MRALLVEAVSLFVNAKLPISHDVMVGMLNEMVAALLMLVSCPDRGRCRCR